MMKANELQETKTLVDIDDTYPEEIVVEGEGGFEYGLSREEERGLIGFIRNLTSPTRREVIKPEKTIYRQKVDAPAGDYTKEYIPAEYGEEEVSLDYAPAVRGTRAAFEYAKSLFGSQETRDEAIAALKQAPAVVEKSMKDQMTAALGMTQGAESVVTREGEEITFDPLAVPATMVPGGIAARAAATEGSTVLGIFGGSKGKSFAEREAAFEKAVNDGLKDEADLPDAWKGDEYLSKMFLDQDVFEKSGGAFRAEDGILKYEIPTRNVKLKTIKEGGVFEDIGGVKIAGSPIDDDTVVFSDLAFQKLKDKKFAEYEKNPENFPSPEEAGSAFSVEGLNNPITLKDVIDFPELFNEYPSLARVKFRVEDLPPGTGAYFTPLDEFNQRVIVVDRQIIAKKEVLKSILHEVQHAVDHVEDRQFGASVQAYLPRNASGELERLAVNTRIHAQTLEGMFPPEKFGNLYPDINNYKALRGFSHEDARTLDIIHKLNSPELIEEMRARNPNPESHAGKLIEAYDSMDDMQRIIFDVYDKEYDKYKQLTEIYQEAQRKYLSTPGEVDARNVEDRFDNPDQQVGGDSPVLPTIFKDTDDAGRTIHKDMSLTGGEDVDDIAFKAASNRTTKAPLRKLLDKLPQKEIDKLPKQPDNNRIFGYHGTARERKPDEPFFDIGFARKNDQFLGEGFYFTLDPKVAEEYANLRAFRDFDVSPLQKGKDPVLTHRETKKKTTVANLQRGLDIEGNPLAMGQSVSRFDLSNIEKPYVVRTEKQRKELKAKIPQLKEEGYDAVLFADFKDRSKQIMVFPEHINKIDTSSMAGRTKSYKQTSSRQISNTQYDKVFNQLDELQTPEEWQAAAKKLVTEERDITGQSVVRRTPALEQSARDLIDNKLITREQHLENIAKNKPITEWTDLPRQPSSKAMTFALKPSQREQGLFLLSKKEADSLNVKQTSLKDGDLFNGRLDIPAYQNYDTWVVAGTSPAVKTADGKGITTYAKAIHYTSGKGKPVRFIASEKTSQEIGTGRKGKTGYATISGKYKATSEDDLRNLAEKYLNDPEWSQVGFDPRRLGKFYLRRATDKYGVGSVVTEADEVIQIGPLVLAKNIKIDPDYEGYRRGGLMARK